MISNETRKLLIASKIKGVGKRGLQALAAEPRFFDLSETDWHLQFRLFRDCLPSSQVLSHALTAAEFDLESAFKQGSTILSEKDALYPKLIRKLKDRPPILFVRGNPANFSEKALAVIGTREPSHHGRLVAERITRYFVERKWQTISGLAVGLDTVAHEVTLTESGSTIAVLAHGLDSLYPKQNAALAERILEGNGLLISEYSYGTPGFPGQFVERDRIQAGLARGVVMVQSGVTGGSWHASRAALNYGRWLFVPAPTSQDIARSSPKAWGNQVMAEGSTTEKIDILKCSPESLKRLMILRSKDDYPIAERHLLQWQDELPRN